MTATAEKIVPANERIAQITKLLTEHHALNDPLLELLEEALGGGCPFEGLAEQLLLNRPLGISAVIDATPEFVEQVLSDDEEVYAELFSNARIKKHILNTIDGDWDLKAEMSNNEDIAELVLGDQAKPDPLDLLAQVIQNYNAQDSDTKHWVELVKLGSPQAFIPRK